MANNYIEIRSWSPFSAQFLYFDLPEYVADNVFGQVGLIPRFYEHLEREGSPYILIRCRVSRKDVHKFHQAMAQLKKNMIIMGHDDYETLCTEVDGMINKAVDEVSTPKSVVSEYEHLRNRAENLNLYLKYVEEHHPDIVAEMDEWFDGMPGYER